MVIRATSAEGRKDNKIPEKYQYETGRQSFIVDHPQHDRTLLESSPEPDLAIASLTFTTLCCVSTLLPIVTLGLTALPASSARTSGFVPTAILTTVLVVGVAGAVITLGTAVVL